MKSRFWSLMLLTYSVCVWLAIEAINAQWNFVLSSREPQPEGSGYGKMRGAMRELQDVLLLFGTWVYPACIIAAFSFFEQSRLAKSKRQKWFSAVCGSVCMGILFRFLWWAVLSRGLG